MGNYGGIHTCIKIIKDYFYHWHDDMTIVMVVAGKVNLRARGIDNFMKVGDILVLNPGEVHKLKAVTKENVIISISFHREFCIKVFDEFDESRILCNSAKYERKNVETYRELQLRLREMIYEYSKGTVNKVEEKAKEVVKYLCCHFDYLAFGNTHQRFSEYIIARNKLMYRKIFLEKSELSNMSLKELSEHIGINYTYLRTDIIQRFGCGYSLIKYTLMTEKAARMILTTDYRLVDISNNCGFSDPKYLRKYIKQFYECTPSDFRKKNKQQNISDAYIELPLKHITRFQDFE